MNITWAATCENVPSDKCTQLRLKSACISMQSDQSSLSTWKNFASLAIQDAPSEDSDPIAQMYLRICAPSEVSDQTAHSCSLVWNFTGCTSPKVCFLMLRFIFFFLFFFCDIQSFVFAQWDTQSFQQVYNYILTDFKNAHPLDVLVLITETMFSSCYWQ